MENNDNIVILQLYTLLAHSPKIQYSFHSHAILKYVEEIEEAQS